MEGQGFFELLDWVYSSGEPFVGTSMKAEIQNLPGAPRVERILDIVYQPLRDQDDRVTGVFVQGVASASVSPPKTPCAAARNSSAPSPNPCPTRLDRTARRRTRLAQSAGVGLFGAARRRSSRMPAGRPSSTQTTCPGAAALWEEARRTVTPYETEFRLRRHDGDYRWHISRAVPIRDCSGEVSAWIGTNTDIHDQKSAIQALSESERRLQLSQSSAGIASLELDIAAGTVYGAAGFWQLWGSSRRQLPDLRARGLVIPEDRHIRSNEETRAGTAVPSVEYRIRRADTGELRWLSRSIDFVADESGKPVKMFGVIQDITERKEAQSAGTAHPRAGAPHQRTSSPWSAPSPPRPCAAPTSIRPRRPSARGFARSPMPMTSSTPRAGRERPCARSSRTPFGRPDRPDIGLGSPLSINPRMALSLALAVNELGTNALKYGALSVPAGRVTIEWSQSEVRPDGTRELSWRWREAGGPPVTAPTRRGFGSFLIERVLGV